MNPFVNTNVSFLWTRKYKKYNSVCGALNCITPNCGLNNGGHHRCSSCNKTGVYHRSCECSDYRSNTLEYAIKVATYGSYCLCMTCVTKDCKIHNCKNCHEKDSTHRACECTKLVIPTLTQKNPIKILYDVASVNHTKLGDNRNTSVSMTLLSNDSKGTLCALVHRRSTTSYSHASKIAGPAGYVEWNQTWGNAAIKEVMEEAGIDISKLMSSVFLIKNNPGQKHHHVSFGLVIPYNIKMKSPSHAFELDTTFSNTINHHKWVSVISLDATHYGNDEIMPFFRQSIKIIRNKFGI